MCVYPLQLALHQNVSVKFNELLSCHIVLASLDEVVGLALPCLLCGIFSLLEAFLLTAFCGFWSNP